MAFSIQSWSRISGSGNNTIKTLQDGTFVGAPCIYTYISAVDNQATIGAANYFLPKIFELNQGDFIWAIDDLGIPEQYLVALVDIPNMAVHVTNASSSAGNVIGPAVSTVNAIPTWNNPTGTLLANSLLTLVNAAGIGTLTWTGAGALNLGASGNGLNITENTVLRTGKLLQFNNPANTFSSTFVEGTSLANKNYTWPLTAPAANGYVLSATTAGVMSWIASQAFAWSAQPASFNAASNNGYVITGGALVTATLPTVANVGDVIEIVGQGAGGWSIAQNASQIIHYNSTSTTTGIGGSFSSTNRYNAVTLVCVVANNEFTVADGSGTFTIV